MVNDPYQALYIEALAELRRTLDELFPDEDHAGRLGPWYDMFHRTQAEVIGLYDATLAPGPGPDRPLNSIKRGQG